MVLLINTTNRNKIELGLSEGRNLRCFEFATNNQSDDILPAIEGILEKTKKNLKDLRGIVVDTDPGSYTGVRIGVTTANTLAWSLDIPVLAYQSDNLDKKVFNIGKIKHFQKLALPQYHAILKKNRK